MTRAPGSLFLFGEYAALVGAPAIVSAVDRYATVTRDPTHTDYRVVGPSGFGTELPRAVCDAVGVAHDQLNALSVDLRGLYAGNQKLGLSSSAASTVALAKALGSVEPERDALAAHTAFQKKSGSGADVKLAARGKTWSVVADACHPPFERVFESTEAPVAIPAGLEIRAVWLGAPASTTSFVRAVADIYAHHEFVRHLVKTLGDVSIGCIDNENADHWIAAARNADIILEDLGQSIGSPVVIDSHRALRDKVPDAFAVKPSGAGGGDFSLVFGPKDADWGAVDIDFADLAFDAPV